MVLNAYDLRNRSAFSELAVRNIAQADMFDETFGLKLCENIKRLRDRFLARTERISNTKVDDIQGVEAEVTKVIVNSVREFLL